MYDLLSSKIPILNYFGEIPLKVLKQSELRNIMLENRKKWKLTKSTKLFNFIEFLFENTKLKKVQLEFPSQTETRYLLGDVSVYELTMSLKRDSYFTHQTAMYFHGLTKDIPKIIYLNFEQPPHYIYNSDLYQDDIDAAFRKPQRVSRNIANYKGKRICILNGMYTGKLGVVNVKGPKGEMISLTNIERTLIDIVVRPAYSGGIKEVLRAYMLARGKYSVNNLVSVLKNLNFIYPYHQAIGFYMERAGYQEKSKEQLSKLGMNNDFYLVSCNI